jgi:WD40 repeat protein
MLICICEIISDAPYCISSTHEHIIATGDEAGVVRLFDIRKKNPIDELLIDDGRCEDTIKVLFIKFCLPCLQFQDVQMSEDGKYLIAISDDGTVSAYNCKRHMFLMESESMGTDLCSIATVKGETKTLVTTASGQIQIYNYKGWGHPSDIIPGHGFHNETFIINNY